MANRKACQYCRRELVRDEVGLSRKLLERETRKGRFTCLDCMADVLEVPVDELKAKIDDFKAEGCKLFS